MEMQTPRGGGGGAGAGAGHQSREMSPYVGPSEPSPYTSHPGSPSTALPSIPTDPHSTAAREQQAAAKQSLKQWWTKFTKQQQLQQQQQQQQQQQGGTSSSSTGVGSGAAGQRRSREDTSPTSSGKGVFGVPLTESLKYAGVAISMVGPDGVNQVYGYIPVVVAKCGLFLKQKATTVEGVFRISGSTRRMKELQDIFDRPPSYGRDVVWGPWSVHDAASVLRRYLNQMPEPVVPYELYDEFRNALPPLDRVKDAAAIHASVLRYKALIACLSSSSKYLLCYVLDLLNVFSRNHEQNLMPAANLAVVFQPGLIRPPHNGAIPIPAPAGTSGGGGAGGNDNSTSGMTPPSFPQLSRSSSNPLTAKPLATAASGGGSNDIATELQRRQDEIKINQEVLEFLINHQDHFVALPEPLSSAEVSPVTPNSTSSQGQAPAASTAGAENPQAIAHANMDVNVATATKVVQSTPRPAPLSQRTPTQPLQAGSAPQTSQPSQTKFTQPSEASQASQTRQMMQPIQPSRPSTLQAPVHHHHHQQQQQGQSQPLPQPVQSGSRAAPAIPAVAAQVNETRMRPAGPFQGSEVRPSGRSGSPVHHRDGVHSSAEPSTTSRQAQSAAVFPATEAAPVQSKKGKGKEAEKDKEERKPRKLKKGRTPTSSGTATPLSPPPLAPHNNPAQAMSDYVSVSHTASGASVPSYDEDTPLAVEGPGVKRSRTLPSPGEKGAAVRSVSGRRQSESRPSPTSLAPEARQGTTPSPLRSPVPLPGSSTSRSSAADSSGAALRPPPPIKLDGYATDDSHNGHGLTARKSPGWRRAFKKDKESHLKAPTAPGMQASRSADSAPMQGDRGAISASSARGEEITVQQRRPSTASAAARSERSGASANNASGQLRAVRNPPFQGQGRGSNSGNNPKFSQEAIRDAVANIGR